MPLRNLNLSRVANAVFLLFFVLVYQSLFSGLFSIHQIKLDLPLLILVFWGLTQGPVSGALFGFILGLLLDLPTPAFLGLGALIKTSLGYMVGSFKDNLFLESSYSKSGIIFLSLCLNDLLYYLFTSRFDIGYTMFIFLNHTLLSAVYTSLVGLIFLWYIQIRRIKKLTEGVSAKL
jgi:rod shape-determining protein MreD